MQTRSYDENSVCPSVRLSVKRVHCDKMEERYIYSTLNIEIMRTRYAKWLSICSWYCKFDNLYVQSGAVIILFLFLLSFLLLVFCLLVLCYHIMWWIKMNIFTFYTNTFILVFWEEEWLVGATPSTWNFGLTGPRWSEIADFEPIISRSASAVTPSEKKFPNTNRKFTRAFQ